MHALVHVPVAFEALLRAKEGALDFELQALRALEPGLGLTAGRFANHHVGHDGVRRDRRSYRPRCARLRETKIGRCRLLRSASVIFGQPLQLDGGIRGLCQPSLHLPPHQD